MTLRRTIAAALLMLALIAAGCAQKGGPESLRIASALDDFHDAASKADESRYFSHFAPEGVFLGTDGTERWPVDEFRRYVHERFSRGDGWTYRPLKRHVDIARDGETAWFDELLINDKYGTCRGSGVFVHRHGDWKIAQYNLTMVIPNDVALEVVDVVKHGARATGSSR